MPVSVLFENLQDMTVEELIEEFSVTREQVEAVLQFLAKSADMAALGRAELQNRKRLEQESNPQGDCSLSKAISLREN